MWQGLVGPCHFCLWDFLMWGLGGAVPEKGVFGARGAVLLLKMVVCGGVATWNAGFLSQRCLWVCWRFGCKRIRVLAVGPGLDLILFIVQLGATGPPRYTLVLQIYNYITNFQLMCFCYMLFVGKMMPVLLSIRCFNDGDWVYRSLVAE